MADVTMDKIVNLAKRRGFTFQSSEIYGGLSSCWDYGPLGIALKRNVKDAWWQSMVESRDDIEGIDCSILMHPRVWEASGHLAGFTDPLVDCRTCKARFRADHMDQAQCAKKPSKKAGEHSECDLTDARSFNLMFKTFMGPMEDTASTVFMRPETAQGIFVNFQNILTTARQRIPFGIAQIGKSFRNEITPGNFLFRTREFEQMEMEFFVKPGEDEHWYEYWSNERLDWYRRLGVRDENLRLRVHEKDELAHYAKACVDVEYNFPIGWSELEGIANRTDFDLRQHAEHSGKDLRFFDEAARERYFPYVIEPAAGADRATLAILADAFDEDEADGEARVVLRFHPKLAPVKVAVLPLMRKEGQPERAQELAASLRQHFTVQYDQAGSIGRRYRRQDEIGTPFGVTVDHQTAEDDTVTLRDRDTMEQERIKIDALVAEIQTRINRPWQR